MYIHQGSAHFMLQQQAPKLRFEMLLPQHAAHNNFKPQKKQHNGC
jgi:hypothetical protein